jgi:membrane associated rhomboid family serine protease
MPFLPLKDDNPVVRISFQYVTLGLIVACLLVFLAQLSLSEPAFEQFLRDYGVIADVLLHPEAARDFWLPPVLTLISYTFVHADWMHLLTNLLFLWVFADNIEDELGHWRFVLFYFACGIAAVFAHVIMSADVGLPLIGASGAISGVLGAYLLLHPHARVLVVAFVPIPLRLPTYVVLGLWALLNVVNALTDDAGGVAWWAHLGGFVTGVLLVGPLTPRRPAAAPDAIS